MSRFQITINNSIIDKLKLNPLFFLRFDQSSYYSNHDHKEIDTSTWNSVDKDLKIHLEASKIDLKANHSKYILCLIEINSISVHLIDGKDIDQNRSDCFVHSVSLKNEGDLKRCFDTYLSHTQSAEINFPFVELLWLLNDQYFESDTIKRVIDQYDQISILRLCNGLKDFGRCLSVAKQKELQSIVSSFNVSFDVYEPALISDAYSSIDKILEYYESCHNIFEAVDLVLDPEMPLVKKDTNGNLLLELRKWLENQEAFPNYSFIPNLLALVSEPVRLKILKRWFHDIRLGNTSFDKDLLSQFKDNRFENFIRFRSSIETPREPMILTVPLLADNIITLIETDGRAFQDFNGVLDFAITHCDTSHPDIDFRMDRFIPRCDGGTEYNVNFAGFLDYAELRKLDESKFNRDNILQVIRRILNQYAEQKPYWACKWDPTKPLAEDQYNNCRKTLSVSQKEDSFNPPSEYQLECCVNCRYQDKWLVKKRDEFDFNVFFKEDIELTEEATEIDISMISVDKFVEFLRLIPSRFQQFDDGAFLVPSTHPRSLLFILVDEFSIITKMRIIPNKNVVAGLRFDIFGIKKSILAQKGIESTSNLNRQDSETIQNEHEELESKEVHSRIVRVLKAKYNLGEYNEEENYFELPFEQVPLDDIAKRFYFKHSVRENAPLTQRSFLTVQSRYFRPFCSPELAKARNEVLDFPFFWCMGKECFKNSLSEQTLEKTKDWQNYTLYHLIEIIGYKKLHMTEAGYEPDEAVRQFIAITNKAMKTFRRLKCRSCGHLLFTDGRNGFNRNNYYSCRNYDCKEFQQPIYMSYCFKCKKGLIDSRDSEQCPNGWYICPDCLSCCDDAQYERLAQRYILSNKPIPLWIQGKRGQGHNDKSIYFCPKCGSQIIHYQDDHGDYHHGCPQCRKTYDL